MKQKIFQAGLIMMACFALTAAAQDWYHDRDDRFRGEEWRPHVFAHVRTDLDHIGSAVFAAPRERRRLETTKRELADLQSQLDNGGSYNERELQDAIDSLVKSSNDQRLAQRDRDILAEDVGRLRDYKEHHEHWMDHRP